MGFWETLFGLKSDADKRVERLEGVAKSYELHEPTCPAHDLNGDRSECTCWITKEAQ